MMVVYISKSSTLIFNFRCDNAVERYTKYTLKHTYVKLPHIIVAAFFIDYNNNIVAINS